MVDQDNAVITQCEVLKRKSIYVDKWVDKEGGGQIMLELHNRKERETD